MPDYLSIPLRFIDPPKEDPALALDPPVIGYFIEPTGARGKLLNRFLLRPDLDLGRERQDGNERARREGARGLQAHRDFSPPRTRCIAG